jgi:hypothetical protein
MSSTKPQRHSTMRHPLDFAPRSSTTIAMLRRIACCGLALSTPYAMFLLNGALKP